MSIARAKRFAQMVIQEWNEIAKEIGSEEIRSKTIDALLADYSGSLFERITKLFNFAFEFRNPDYKPVSAEWVMDNLPIRALKVIAREVLEQNQLGDLVPFFQRVGQQIKLGAAAAANKIIGQ